MARPAKCRRIACSPPASGFKPVGVPGREMETLALTLDELEALRLADLEGLYFESAAEQMGVSRPTFGRLVSRARHKVACALFQHKMLIFEGGPIIMTNQRTFACGNCGATVQAPHGTPRPAECPQCHGHDLQRAADERGGRSGGRGGHGGGGGHGCCCRRRAGWSRGAERETDVSTQATSRPAGDAGDASEEATQ